MLGTSHLFHLVSNSKWPFFSSIGAFFFFTGLTFSFHRIFYGSTILLLGLIILLLTVYYWFRDICEEADLGYHTFVVKRGLKYGFLLFILSELMLFFGFFWAFFHSSILPSIFVGNDWPYFGIFAIDTYKFPLLNTLLLITSGISITWAHRGIALGSFSNTIDALLFTIFLGSVFLFLQCLEYFESTFNIDDGIFPSIFFMLTGLHGCHVFLGVCFIFFCFLRLLLNQYSTSHYLGLIFAIWYWHFVDIVWLVLFFTIYGWGGL